MKRKLSAVALLAAVTVIGFAASAGAVDGTIEINQVKALVAGFPYVITASGSYRLTGNLTVSSTSADAIDVNASHVTIDLNGFSITGPGASGSGSGIAGSPANELTVENGAITGFRNGLSIGANSIVKSIHIDGNTNGIVTGSDAVISGDTVVANGTGINCGGSGCLVSGNTIDNNTGAPMSFNNATSGYGGNVLNGNGSGISGGTSLGAKNTNLCNGTAC
jgi:hypothetical protein